MVISRKLQFGAALLPIFAVAFSAAIAQEPTIAPQAITPTVFPQGLDAMIAKSGSGDIRVIFTLSPKPGSVRGGSDLSTQAFNLPEAEMASAQQALGRVMSETGVKEIKPIVGTPLVVGVVNAAQLRTLASSGLISAYEEDIVVQPNLSVSVPLINAPSVWLNPATKGAGQVVAVLDTGVATGHNFLVGKTVSEACFSTNGTGISSLCPSGVTSSTAVGSAAPCNIPGQACWHGTHVAGISVGKANGTTTFNGVAPEAKVLPIQVFSNNGGGLGAFSSDIIAGLAHVKAKKIAGVNIASANLSLGGGSYTSGCGGSAIDTVITQLRALNVATVIASGNNGFSNAVAWPACVPNATTVGSSTKTNTLSPFSNSSPQIDVLAPGSAINSATSTSPSSYSIASGTSMAAPHVAGAYALLRARFQCMPHSMLENALNSTGVSITHPTTGAVYKRINVQAAVAQLNPYRLQHLCRTIVNPRDISKELLPRTKE